MHTVAPDASAMAPVSMAPVSASVSAHSSRPVSGSACAQEGPPVRVLALPRYGRLGATTRYRFTQFQPALERLGVHVEVAPLLSDALLRCRYQSRKRSSWEVFGAYLRRIACMLTAHRYDVLWVEKECLPWVPSLVEHLACRRMPIVVDYDDAEFHRYDSHRSALVRAVLGKKIASVMRRADWLVAGNEYIAQHARKLCSAKIEIVPTVVDLNRYRATEAPPAGSAPFTVGWIGTPVTAEYLRPIQPALEQVCGQGRGRLIAVGAGDLRLGSVPVESPPWSEAEEADQIARFDVGVMPLPDSPFSRGKCGLKLIQYMAAGRPVVGTPLGVNATIIRPGHNGFHAATVQQWTDRLLQLRADAGLRQRMGKAGRGDVEQGFSLDGAVPRLAGILRSAAQAA